MGDRPIGKGKGRRKGDGGRREGEERTIDKRKEVEKE